MTRGRGKGSWTGVVEKGVVEENSSRKGLVDNAVSTGGSRSTRGAGSPLLWGTEVPGLSGQVQAGVEGAGRASELSLTSP